PPPLPATLLPYPTLFRSLREPETPRVDRVRAAAQHQHGLVVAHEHQRLDDLPHAAADRGRGVLRGPRPFRELANAMKESPRLRRSEEHTSELQSRVDLVC